MVRAGGRERERGRERWWKREEGRQGDQEEGERERWWKREGRE